MANRRLPVRKVKELFRLHFQAGLSGRKIARSCQVARQSVAEYLKRAKDTELDWERIQQLSETELDQLLFPGSSERSSRPQPDFAAIHKELQHPHVTRQLLWQEYKQAHPDGYQYSQFCDLYRGWREKLDVVLRQRHRAGEKMFVDYAGPQVDIVDPKTGEIRPASIFVAVLGASNYTFAEATWTQELGNWLGSHTRAVEFFDGVPRVVVPDNTRTGVTHPCFYEPELNPSYAEWAEHYQVAVLPARPRKPRDKAKVESAVLVVERWILAALRHHRFFSLAELNQQIARLLEKLNERPFRKLPDNRRELYEKIDRPALGPLPASRHQPAFWKKARVNIDYHVELERHYYSVPYALVRRPVEIRYTHTTVEIFHAGRRVASHRRSRTPGDHTTDPEHRPECHRRYLEWSPSRLIRWGETIGPATGAVIEKILASRRYPEQAYRSCLGLLRLGKSFGNDRLEAACKRALAFGATSYSSVRSILSKGLDAEPLDSSPAPQQPALDHSNIRGSDYFNSRRIKKHADSTDS